MEAAMPMQMVETSHLIYCMVSWMAIPALIGGQGGGLSGQTTDIKIHAEHMVYIRDKMNRMLSEYTGQPLEKIQQDTERDNYLTAQQAKEYGLIDEVIAHR